MASVHSLTLLSFSPCDRHMHGCQIPDGHYHTKPSIDSNQDPLSRVTLALEDQERGGEIESNLKKTLLEEQFDKWYDRTSLLYPGRIPSFEEQMHCFKGSQLLDGFEKWYLRASVLASRMTI